MISLTNLKRFLDNYLLYDKKLAVEKIDPIMANGLMIRGTEDVRKVGFGVSASLALFEKGKEEECDAIIVHHSFNHPPHNRYDEIFQNRVSYLLKNNMSLFGFHFLLDAHKEVGNNVEILKSIGAKPIKPYLHRGNPWGWVGEFENTTDFKAIEKNFSKYLGKRAVVYNYGPEKIKRVAAVSGKGAPFPGDMQGLIDEKIDLFITGEIHEWNKELFHEADINCIAGGHYATEKFGVTALMSKLKRDLKDIEVAWLEVINDV